MSASKQTAFDYIDEKSGVITDVSDKIWDYAELSLREYKSGELYAKVLKEEGFTVEHPFDNIETAFRASYGSGKPVIGILAEYDALTGLSQIAGSETRKELVADGNGHGCGHNLLGAGSLAAAAAVKDYLEKSGGSGTVIFFGCPGEEGGSGKAFMAREGLWKKLDAALSWHPSDVNQVRTGTNNSCIQVLYKFSGVAAHAAGDPYNGRRALDAVELLNIGVQFLREHTTEDCRIHYAIVDAGGISPNVVQAKASVLYMVRANKVADSVKLQARVDKIARGAALMTETSFERVFIDGTSELLPNYTIEKMLHDNMELVGVPEYDEEDLAFARALRETYPPETKVPGIGAGSDEKIADKVRELTENMTKPINDFIMPMYSGNDFVPGSTDVGDVSWLTPTSQIDAVTWPAGIPNHSWQVVSCGKSGIGYKGMLMAAKVLACTAIELFECPDKLKAAKEEFLKRSASGYVCPIEPGEQPKAI